MYISTISAIAFASFVASLPKPHPANPKEIQPQFAPDAAGAGSSANSIVEMHRKPSNLTMMQRSAKSQTRVQTKYKTLALQYLMEEEHAGKQKRGIADILGSIFSSGSSSSSTSSGSSPNSGSGSTSNGQTGAKSKTSLANINNELFVAQVTLSNGQTFQMDLDTGSSDSWIRGPDCQSSDASCDGKKVSSSFGESVNGKSFVTNYGSGRVEGDIVMASLTVGSTKAKPFAMGVSRVEHGFADGASEGLLGLAYNSISQISTAAGVNANFLDAAYGQDNRDNVVAFYLSQDVDNSGEVTFGGVNPKRFVGDMLFVPLNSNSFWQFDFSDAKYQVGKEGVGRLSLNLRNAIVDTGTTLMIVDREAADGINSKIGAQLNEKQGVYIFSDCDAALRGPDIQMSFQGITFSLEPNSYVVRQKGGLCFSGISAAKSGARQAILGDTFIKQYYTAFDKANNRLGFALASDTKGRAFSQATANLLATEISTPNSRKSVPGDETVKALPPPSAANMVPGSFPSRSSAKTDASTRLSACTLVSLIVSILAAAV